MANNPLVDIFRIRDLRNRILFTLSVLVVHRIGSIIPVPGIDMGALSRFFSGSGGDGQGIVDYLDFFSGGAFKNFSIFMLGVMPYITTSIIMQVLMLVFPALKKISEEDGGRKKIQRFTRYATVFVCLLQGAALLQMPLNYGVVISGIAKWQFLMLGMLTTTAGTILLMWLGEQINVKGVGNGISLLIFTGIVARMPNAFIVMFREIRAQNLNEVFVILTFVMFFGVVILVIYEQQGLRKIPVNYASRIVGRKQYRGQSSYIPFKINPSGVIPVIFASSILTIPVQLSSSLASGNSEFWGKVATAFGTRGPLYLTLYTLLIIFFAYFYTQVSLNPVEISKQIRENGGSIPGIRSENMEAYLTRILNRIVLPGSMFLAMIALIPSLLIIVIPGFPRQMAYIMGGTSLLIMVGVDLDTMSQIEGHLKMHHHEGLTKSGKLRSRNL
ncbi:MAG: preprotein translocase subunit SecY [Spirochaetaceae bacterium]|nr:preprotein translocase subunit SecY [Spirochaetaceae bacterium]RKX78934.1 MAG: preprotein translocase subunit SecY [Spirochaetota bacterium]RKX89679.1 MAG: preprotein translocase subunit SecY [Spirochaetota bacterium]RKX96206.1 MAG: preprotein translocase subunit SecY [Spirochaetota bacterium]